MKMRNLAIQLSNLQNHPCNNVELEQYGIDGNLASRWLSDIVSFGDLFEDCKVLDLGAGNGILGIGSLLLGANSATFIESDSDACEVLSKNLHAHELLNSSEIINYHIDDTNLPIVDADLIITNPPWGRQIEKADRPFLQTILSNNKTAHILHSSNATHISNFFRSERWTVEKYGEADFSLPATYSHHNRKRDRTRAGFWRVSPN
tara:strand:- start:238 stop:852 length:615 start_codon:yes stop_codon:yes gene_type:complete